MKKRIGMGILALALIVSFAMGTSSFAVATGEEGQPQVTCPVMGGKVNKDIYVDYQGMRIYFCCSACPEMFMKDPDKYLEKLKESGQVPERLENTQ